MINKRDIQETKTNPVGEYPPCLLLMRQIVKIPTMTKGDNTINIQNITE